MPLPVVPDTSDRPAERVLLSLLPYVLLPPLPLTLVEERFDAESDSGVAEPETSHFTHRLNRIP